MRLLRALRALLARPRVRFVLGTLLSALALGFLAREVDLREAARALRQAHAGFVLAAVGGTTLHMVAKGERWKVLLGERGASLPRREVMRVLLIGQMLNTFIPIRAGDVARVYLIGGLGPGRAFTLGSLVVEKGADLLSYAALFFCFFSGYRCQPGLAPPPSPWCKRCWCSAAGLPCSCSFASGSCSG